MKKLSRQERIVLTHVACGLTDNDIARKLKISPRTVEKHVFTIMTKLQAKNRVNAVVIYIVLNPNWISKLKKILL